jgi:hypothetical protein
MPPRIRDRRPDAFRQVVPSASDQRPLFSFYHLEDGFRVSDCQARDRGDFAVRLEELSQLTWTQIILAPRQGLGAETIKRESIRVRVPSDLTRDLRIIAFRFGSGARIVGYREDRVFHVIWVDPNHRVY